jgi:hypothetical protein
MVRTRRLSRSSEVISGVNYAWEKLVPDQVYQQQDGLVVYIYSYANVGTKGENYLKVVVDPHTNRPITGYPQP